MSGQKTSRCMLRLHFAKQESTLQEALNRLEHLREKMGKLSHF
jgi:hypothetical protein